MEDTAREVYKDIMTEYHSELLTKKYGPVISTDYCYIAASTDASVTTSSCSEECVEIKYPSKYKDSTIENVIQEDSYLIKNEAGALNLDKNHGYFCQLQTNLLVI